MTPTENWPKPWLLSIHEQAVAEGFIWIEPISQADADSLKSRLYRIRRRSDKSMAAFIPPEYHLVMVGQWEAGPNGTGRLPVIYNKKPDGLDLPSIRKASGEEVEAYTPRPRAPAPVIHDAPPELHFDADDLTMKPDEINGFVASMRKSAKERQ